MPDGTTSQRRALLSDSSVQTVEKLHELGAMVFVTHPEKRTTEELIDLPIDGIDVYNFHRNADPRDLLHPDEKPGGLSWGNVWETVKLVSQSWERAEADLVLLGFLEENRRDLDHWDKMLYERRTVGILATDVHRNALEFSLPDGDRADSYRRLMRWFANYVLVRDQNLEEIETAVRKGRMYGAFQVFGEPVGFDYYAETVPGTFFEMGDEVPWSADLKLHVKLPQFYRMNPNFEKPQMIARIIKAGKNGGTQVESSHNQDLVISVKEPGAYRAEIHIYPFHLKNWLGDTPNNFMSDEGYPFIYANAIYVK
jgi:hypothetical protein